MRKTKKKTEIQLFIGHKMYPGESISKIDGSVLLFSIPENQLQNPRTFSLENRF